MIKTKEAIRIARGMIGTAYSEIDCINLIKKVIRTAPGGEKSYTTAGTNTLWNSTAGSAKYRDLTDRWRGIDDAKPGMLAFMGAETGDVNHVGLVTESGTVIHSSKSRGEVVETELTAKAGWDGLGIHRLIEVSETENQAENQAKGGETGHETGELVTVCARHGLRMRKKPDGIYMQMIPDGTRLIVQDVKNGWLKVSYRGHTGWVSGDYCLAAGED